MARAYRAARALDASTRQRVPTNPATSQPTAVAASKPAIVKGGTFVDTSIVDAKTMQPLLAQDSGSLSFIALQYDAPLLRTDPRTLDPAPFAARSYTISDDKLSITYKLRDDLLWSDGQKITSADYKFTWDRMMDEKVNFPYRKLFQDYFTSLTAPDDATLVFQLKEVFAPALLYSGIDAIPKHVFENLDINDNPQNNNPTVGSGAVPAEAVAQGRVRRVRRERSLLPGTAEPGPLLDQDRSRRHHRVLPVQVPGDRRRRGAAAGLGGGEESPVRPAAELLLGQCQLVVYGDEPAQPDPGRPTCAMRSRARWIARR